MFQMNAIEIRKHLLLILINITNQRNRLTVSFDFFDFKICRQEYL